MAGEAATAGEARCGTAGEATEARSEALPPPPRAAGGTRQWAAARRASHRGTRPYIKGRSSITAFVPKNGR